MVTAGPKARPRVASGLHREQQEAPRSGSIAKNLQSIEDIVQNHAAGAGWGGEGAQARYERVSRAHSTVRHAAAPETEEEAVHALDMAVLDLPWCDVQPETLLAGSASAKAPIPLVPAPRLLPAEGTAATFSVQHATEQLLAGNSASYAPPASLVGALMPWLQPQWGGHCGPLSGSMRQHAHWQLLAASPLAPQVALKAQTVSPHQTRKKAPRRSLAASLAAGQALAEGHEGVHDQVAALGGSDSQPLPHMLPVHPGGDLMRPHTDVIVPADVGDDEPMFDWTGVGGWLWGVACALLQEDSASATAHHVLETLRSLHSSAGGGLEPPTPAPADAPSPALDKLLAALPQLQHTAQLSGLSSRLLSQHPETLQAHALVLHRLCGTDMASQVLLTTTQPASYVQRLAAQVQGRWECVRGMAASMKDALRLLRYSSIESEQLLALKACAGYQAPTRTRRGSVSFHHTPAASEERDSSLDSLLRGMGGAAFSDGQGVGAHVSYIRVRLVRGHFGQGKKKAGLNLQVRVHAVKRDGSVFPCLVRGVGWGSSAMPRDLGQGVARAFTGTATDADGGAFPATAHFTDGSGVVSVAVHENNAAKPTRRRSMSATRPVGVSIASPGSSQGEAPEAGPRPRSAAGSRIRPDLPHEHVVAEGRKLAPEYRSAVYYHVNDPEWDEAVTLVVPTVELLDSLHIRLAYYHVSANEGRSFPVGFSFFPLVHPRTRVGMRAGLYTLPVFDAVQYMSTAQRSVAKSAAPYRRASALRLSMDGDGADSMIGGGGSRRGSRRPSVAGHARRNLAGYIGSFEDSPLARSMFEPLPGRAASPAVESSRRSRATVRDRSLLLVKEAEHVVVEVTSDSPRRPANAALHVLYDWSTHTDGPHLEAALWALHDLPAPTLLSVLEPMFRHLSDLVVWLGSTAEASQSHAGAAADPSASSDSDSTATMDSASDGPRSVEGGGVLQHPLKKAAISLLLTHLSALQGLSEPPPNVAVATEDMQGQAAHVACKAPPSLGSLASSLRSGVLPGDGRRGKRARSTSGGSASASGESKDPSPTRVPMHLAGAHIYATPSVRQVARLALRHCMGRGAFPARLAEPLSRWTQALLEAMLEGQQVDSACRSIFVLVLACLPDVARLLVHTQLAAGGGAASASAAMLAIRQALLRVCRLPVVAPLGDKAPSVQTLAWHAVLQTAALRAVAPLCTVMLGVTSCSTLQAWCAKLLRAIQPRALVPALSGLAGSAHPPLETLGGGTASKQRLAGASIRWRSVPLAYKYRGWVPASTALAIAKLSCIQQVLCIPELAPRPARCGCEGMEAGTALWNAAAHTSKVHLNSNEAERTLAAAILHRMVAQLHAAAVASAPAESPAPTPPLLPARGPSAGPLAAAAWAVFTSLPELSRAIVEVGAVGGEGGSGLPPSDASAPHHNSPGSLQSPPHARLLAPAAPAQYVNLGACPVGPQGSAAVIGKVVAGALVLPSRPPTLEDVDTVRVPRAARARFAFLGGDPAQRTPSAEHEKVETPLLHCFVLLQACIGHVAQLSLLAGGLVNVVGAGKELGDEPLLAAGALAKLLPAVSEGSEPPLQAARGDGQVAAEPGPAPSKGATVSFSEATPQDPEDVPGSRRSWSTFTTRSMGVLSTMSEASHAEDKSETESVAEGAPSPPDEPVKRVLPGAGEALGVQPCKTTLYQWLADTLASLLLLMPSGSFPALCRAVSQHASGLVGQGACAAERATGQRGPGLGKEEEGQGAVEGSCPLDPFMTAGLLEAGRLSVLRRLAGAIEVLLARPPHPASWVHAACTTHVACLRGLHWASIASASLYLHSHVGKQGPAACFLLDVAAGFLLRPLLRTHIALLTSPLATVESLPLVRRRAVVKTLASMGMPDFREAVMGSFSTLWGDACVPAPEAFLPSTASPRVLAQSPDGNGSYLPHRLRLAAAPLLVPTALELAHACHKPMASWARSVFFDIIRAEVKVVASSGKSSPRRMQRRSFAVALSTQADTSTTLPISERWTIDAVDAIVARGGALLLPPSACVGGGTFPVLGVGLIHSDKGQGQAGNMLLQLFSASGSQYQHGMDPQHLRLLARPEVAQFLAECRTLFRMLRAVNRYPRSPPALFEEERTEAALTLIQYLRNTHRTDLFVTYVKYLSKLHAEVGNHAEAAFTQLLFLDLVAAREGGMPPPTSEAGNNVTNILHDAFEALADGSQDWEEALVLARLLSCRYFAVGTRQAYNSLADVLSRSSAIVTKLAKESTGRSKARARCPHYAVQYVGAAFPPSLRGRTFVYRAHSTVAVSVFERQLRLKWATVMSATEDSLQAAGALDPEQLPPGAPSLIKVPFEPLRQASHLDGAPARVADDISAVQTTTQQALDVSELPWHRDLRIAVMAVDPAPLHEQEAVEGAVLYVEEHLAAYGVPPLEPSPEWHDGPPSELRASGLLASVGPTGEADHAFASFASLCKTARKIGVSGAMVPPSHVAWKSYTLPPQIPHQPAFIQTPRQLLAPPPPVEAFAHPRTLAVLRSLPSLKTGAFSLHALTSAALVQDIDLDSAVASVLCAGASDTRMPTTLPSAAKPVSATRRASALSPSTLPTKRSSMVRSTRGASSGGGLSSVREGSSQMPAAAAAERTVSDVSSGTRHSVVSLSRLDSLDMGEGVLQLVQSGLEEHGSEGALPPGFKLLPPALLPSVTVPSMSFVPTRQDAQGSSRPVDADGGQRWESLWGPVLAAVQSAARAQASKYDDVPRPLLQGREYSRVRVFLSKRPVKVRKTGNESLDIWVRYTWLVTSSAFPNLHRRSQVTHAHTVLMTPFDSAILVLREKTADMRFAIQRAAAAPAGTDVNFLTGQLKGVLDAAVQGGIANYETLLTGSYAETYPEILEELKVRYGRIIGNWRSSVVSTHSIHTVAGDSDSEGAPERKQSSDMHELVGEDARSDADAPALAALRHALSEQLTVCGKGLVLHATKCSASMLPLHDYLCEKLAGLCDRLEGLGVPLEEARFEGTQARQMSQESQVIGAQAAASRR